MRDEHRVYVRRFAAPPDVLHLCQRTPEHGDCVVAALSMACGVTYETALAAAAQIAPDVLLEGLTWDESRKVAKKLGFTSTLKRRGSYDIEESTGLLHVYDPRNKRQTSHAVYLWEGRVIEPMTTRQQMWLSAEEYVKHYKYRYGSLQVIHSKED